MVVLFLLYIFVRLLFYTLISLSVLDSVDLPKETYAIISIIVLIEEMLLIFSRKSLDHDFRARCVLSDSDIPSVMNE